MLSSTLCGHMYAYANMCMQAHTWIEVKLKMKRMISYNLDLIRSLVFSSRVPELIQEPLDWKGLKGISCSPSLTFKWGTGWKLKANPAISLSQTAWWGGVGVQKLFLVWQCRVRWGMPLSPGFSSGLLLSCPASFTFQLPTESLTNSLYSLFVYLGAASHRGIFLSGHKCLTRSWDKLHGNVTWNTWTSLAVLGSMTKRW